MEFANLLTSKRDAILKKWFAAVAGTYPIDTSGFLKTTKDKFANPVGGAITDALGSMFDELVYGMDREILIHNIEPMIKVRAVQNFSPSQAVSFIFSLKKIVRETLAKKLENYKIRESLFLFESRVDDLVMLSFDIFMGCKERLYDIKANEEKSKVYKAFKRAGLITEIQDDDPGLLDSNNI
jgi:RsbT co-antagonist protein rsbRD N-terminal domain